MNVAALEKSVKSELKNTEATKKKMQTPNNRIPADFKNTCLLTPKINATTTYNARIRSAIPNAKMCVIPVRTKKNIANVKLPFFSPENAKSCK